MEYRMSGGNKALLYIFSVFLFGVGIFTIYNALHTGKPGIFIVAAFALGVSFLLYHSASRLLLTIDEYSITLYNGFTTKSVLLDEIGGFRPGDKDALVLVRKSGERALTIPGTMEQRSELRDWLKERYPDINAQLAREVTEEVLHEERYGLTEEDRARRLTQARKIMLYSAFVAPLFIGWVLIRPQPFKLLMLILLTVPLAAVWLTWSYKGILRLYMSKTRPYPTLAMAVFFTEAAAFVAVFREYNIYLINERFWGLVLGVTIFVLLVWAMACRGAAAGEKNLFAVYAGMLLLGGVYSYCAVLFVNCEYDHQRGVITRVSVDGKHVSGGKMKTYYLNLSPWGRFADENDARVSQSFYYSVSTGDSVNVYLHPGEWGVPWYEVYRY